MSKREKNKTKKKVFKYPKPKRTHKEAFPDMREKERNSYFQKKKNIPSKTEASIIIKKEEEVKEDNVIIYDLNYLYKNIVENNDKIQIKKEILQNQIYEENFYEIKKITGDGNCFFRSISYYLNNSEEMYYSLRNAIYLFVKDNITKFYEYCYVEEDIYYIDIEEDGTIHKYILDEYVDKIKEDGFFSGFIEINAAAYIINRPIIILENLEFLKSYLFFNKVALFINNENEIFNIEDIIFINYVNRNHYQLLKPSIEFILSRIKNIKNLEYNFVHYDRKNNQIIDLRNETNSILDNIDNEIIETKIEKKSKEDIKKIIIKQRKLISNTSPNDEYKNNKKNIDDSKKVNLESPSDKNSKEEKLFKKEKEKKEENRIANVANKEYMNLIKNFKTKYIEFDNNQEIEIPKYPLLIGEKIAEEFYSDIYRYLFIEKHNLNIFRYPQWVSEIHPKNKRENKKKDLREKYNKYYLDENNKLCRKFELNEKRKKYINLNAKTVEIKQILYHLLYVPETLDILSYLFSIHKDDGHKGIASLRQYLVYNNIYFEGYTYLTEYVVKNCISCAGKNKNKLKREPPKQIITFCPRQRYIMDITELPIELKGNNNYAYLFNIIDHFSKFGMSYLIENKKSSTVYKNLKFALDCNGFPSEIGSDNGKEFRNELIENYLKSKNINYIHGMPYNPHSQGVVERFHKTIKDGLYCRYNDNPGNFDIKQSLEFIIKKYNNHIHSSTKYTPNEIFYSNDEELFNKVLGNIKESFKKKFGEKNFEDNEKCLLNKKFKIKKIYNNEQPGILIYDNIKKKNLYGKINVTVLNKIGTHYKIKIEKDYDDLNLFQNDIYIVEYSLLSKCSEKVWMNLLEKDDKKSEISLDDILNSDYSFNEEETNFIIKEKDELN